MILLGHVSAASVSFDKLVDLRGSSFRAGADFSNATFNGPAVFTDVQATGDQTVHFDFATFHGAALFSGSSFAGATTFADAEFDRASRFRHVHFNGLADFDSAWFGDAADFTGAIFKTDGRFNAVEFHSVADFSNAQFGQRALFGASRFSQPADFSGAVFGGASQQTASFHGVRFDAGASFLDAEFDGKANFDRVQSAGDMAFDGVDFEQTASFSTVQLLGTTSFSQALLYARLNFDQASLHRLDLDGAQFMPKSTVELPLKNAAGRVDELRFDPADVSHIGVGRGQASDARREHALALVETFALRGGDGKAANEAQLKRWTLKRGDRPAPLHALDWAFMWGIGGYLVRPLHPVATIGALLVLCALFRILWARFKAKKPIGPILAARRSIAAFWRLQIHEGTGWQQLEATSYKLLLALLFLNLANVWPVVHDLLKGVFA